jgi:hypothetical protein
MTKLAITRMLPMQIQRSDIFARMKHLALMVGISCVLFAGGCKKKGAEVGAGSGSDTGSATAGSGSAAGSAAAGSGSSAAAETKPSTTVCVDGAYKDPAGKYCVKLPDGYAAPPTKIFDNQEAFMAADGSALTVAVWKQPDMTWDNMKGTAAQHTEGNKPSEAIELDGGNAYWVKIHLVGSKQTRTSYSIKVGDKFIMDCTILYSDKAPPNPLDVCKTLKAL